MSGAQGADASGLHFRSAGALVERARSTLSDGPLSTGALAERVMGVRNGGARAAAAAIFGLLGADPRFVVNGEGVWSLAAPRPTAAAASLREEEWVVVDVETTGGTPDRGHRVTEVAAVWVSDGRVTETFSTLVNPECRIPAMITSLTGITSAMVASAPRFHEIAPRLADSLRGRVFVAHNASFDWRFVSAEMERSLGQLPDGRQLCTVRLARKLLPQLTSRSLDALAHYFGLEIASRHRALDDAVATAAVLIRFMDMLAERGMEDWAAVEALLRKRAPRRKRQASPRSMDSA